MTRAAAEDRPGAQEIAAASNTRAMVVGPYPSVHRPGADRTSTTRSPEARFEEAGGLARAIDLNVVASARLTLNAIRPATYLGKGKVEEIAALAKDNEVDLVVMDCALSPVQQRNLEKAFKTKVIDRTGLILEIFGRRARTSEGVLQVELAHLAYQKSRLVRSWTHLERQRGGFGFLGGPGETQIETDRRLIQERMIRIERDLEERHEDARAASREPQRGSLSDRRAGRLHQCGQVDAVQPADARRSGRRRHAVRHARSDDAAAEAAPRRRGDPLRHRRLHLRSADDADFGVSRHAGGGASPPT